MWFPGLWRIAAWRVNRLWARRQQEAAVRLASRFVQLRPRDPNAAWLLGNVLFQSGENAKAESALRAASESHPDSPELALLLADVLRSEGKNEEAIDTLIRQRRRTPRSAIPIQGLVSLAKHQGAWNKVLSLAKEAEALIASDDFAGRYELGARLIDVPTTRFLAERLLREASVGLSRHGMCNVLLAVLLEASDHEEAAKHMTLARRHWRGPTPIDEFADQVRESLAHPRRSEPPANQLGVPESRN